ncbi:unnamed protein product [Staurois parvus]|uniref:Uncharacterized protein n=1 Tax=Staurois parvus TaxID=386267 RepID=A0ABN9BLY8_9NEOB|nr:unnamed protein product [Staurois parvus]
MVSPPLFTLQKLRIYCDPEQNKRETACEIPGIVRTCLSYIVMKMHTIYFMFII